jgi:putative MATE family efflux protein
MNNLTQGNLSRHIVRMAMPIVIGMIFQTLYYVVDLYFVAAIGDAAVAGVTAAGNATFLVIALTQALSVGTVVLIAQAAGRKDQADANLVFNQSLVLALGSALLVLAAGYGLAHGYVQSVAADAATVAAGTTYLYWFLPSLALQCVIAVLGAALRGTGIVRPTMLVQLLSVVLNAVLAPVFIAGWITGRPMGVAGAGLASSIAVGVGVIVLLIYFIRLEHFVAVARGLLRPRPQTLRRLLGVGLPAGGEMMLMFVSTAAIYWAIRGFGPAAQAGYGIGSRMMQALVMPAMAIGFAVPAIAGQNFGARNAERVRETFRIAVTMITVFMIVVTVFAQWQPALLIRAFSDDPAAIAAGGRFMQLVSWNFVAQGLILGCSCMFQGLGNTRPALLSSLARVVVFVGATVWVSKTADFRIEQIWYLAIGTVTLQAVISWLLLRSQMRRRLAMLAAAPGAQSKAA